MNKMLQEVHEKAKTYQEKYNDPELHDFLMKLASELEKADLLHHQFGYFVMHAQAVVPYDAAPHHFREALTRARKYLREAEADSNQDDAK